MSKDIAQSLFDLFPDHGITDEEARALRAQAGSLLEQAKEAEGEEEKEESKKADSEKDDDEDEEEEKKNQ